MKRSILLGLIISLFINLQSFGTVTFVMKNYSAQTGSQITIPVKVTGFNSVLSIQGSIQFDQTKLQFVSLQDFTSLSGMTLGGFGITQVSSGKLTFSWMEPGLSGLTLPDSGTIFSIKFNVIGSAGQTIPLQFVNSPTPFEVVDPTMAPISYALVNGSVYIFTSVSVPENADNRFHVYQNEPNPFSDQTRFVFTLPEEGKVSLEVYNILGDKVSSFEGSFQAGERSFEWDASNIYGAKLQRGTYFCRLSFGNYVQVIKVLIEK
jgi:hypothetical protein